MFSLKNKVTIPALIFLLTFVVFGNTLFHKFTYDDHKSIENNDLFSSPAKLSILFHKGYFEKSHEKSYRPLVTASYFLDCQLWGKNPSGYHLTNILVHAITGVLFFLFSGFFFKNIYTRFVASLFFVFHPVVCEPVNAVSFREDLLAGMFVLAALLAMRNTSVRNVFLFCFFAFLALFSKESALPVIFIPLVLYVLQKKGSILASWSPPRGSFYWALALVYVFYLALRFFIMIPGEKEAYPVLAGSPLGAIAHSGYLFLNAWKTLVFPFQLNADYVFWDVKGIFTFQSLLGILFAIGYLVVLYMLFRKRKFISVFALCWISLFFLPVSNMAPLTHPFAERYLYLPLMGVALVFGCLWEWFLEGFINREGSRQVRFYFIPGVVLLILAFVSIRRNLVWSTEQTLWKATLRREPRSIPALNGMGIFAIHSKDFDQAEKHFLRALELAPHDYELRNNLAVVYLNTGRTGEAIGQLEQALTLKPDYAPAHYNLALLYYQRGGEDLLKAKRHGETAVRFGYPVPKEFLEKIRGSN